MEWNGLLYNKKKSLEQSELLDKQVKDIETKLNLLINFELDWNSNDEKSAILYGGIVKRIYKIPIGHYKSGPKTGLTRYKNETQVYTFNRQIEPLKGTEYKKGNVWSVDEPTLRSLKPNKQIKNIINLILERAKLEKLNGTYLKGLPKKLETNNWGNILHPTYNQCVAVTGRVASSDPNGQNLAPLCKQLIESRF
jgi:DNA polymerase I-like protein with 3'-5' exonuclease and polymerase domains